MKLITHIKALKSIMKTINNNNDGEKKKKQKQKRSFLFKQRLNKS